MFEPSDLELVERARAGDLDAFDVLVRRFHSRVRSLCVSLLGVPADADDAAQEIFIKAFRSLGGFQGRARFSTWLFQVALNHCKDMRRKAACRRTQSLDALLESSGDAVLELSREPAGKPWPSDDEELALRVLASMREDYREVLVLRETHGLRYDEIAAALGCTLEAVRARLRRARRELRERFGRLRSTEGSWLREEARSL